MIGFPTPRFSDHPIPAITGATGTRGFRVLGWDHPISLS
jgi:hypothetical protein